MSKQKILILGANGFQGSTLVNYFAARPEYEVFGSYHNDITKSNNDKTRYLQSDLTKKEDVEYLFESVKPDVVLQYAAYTTNSKDVIDQPYTHATTNYIINALVLEAAHRADVKHFLYPSCSTMYRSENYPQPEKDYRIYNIPNQYTHVANMKISVENMCYAYSKMNKCKFTILRNSNIFGIGDKTDLDKAHLVPSIIQKVIKATNKMEVWGDPINQAKRDILYVDDVVNLVEKAIELQQSPYEIFNCGQGKAYSVSEIVEMIKNALGKNLEIIYNTNKPNIPTTVILDCSKAKNELGWEPKVSIEEGLKRTIEWYKENYAV